MPNRIAYHNGNWFRISTIRSPGFRRRFETAVAHLAYNDGQYVTVAQYKTIEAAMTGHEHWVRVMSAETLPEYLEIASTSLLARYLDMTRGKEWRRHPRQRTLVVMR